MEARILGLAYHLPERVETNDDLQRENPDWRMQELYEKSGIWARHIAAEGETASDLGYQAAEQLLQRGLVAREAIDYLLFCTQGPDHFLPSTACILQNRLHLGKHVGALDYNLGCSGWIYGLQLAAALITSGEARCVLLVTADTYTKYIHPRDRTVRTLFGDGAAATLVGPTNGVGRIGTFVIGTDGTGAERLIVPSGGLRIPRSPATAEETTDGSGCTRAKDNLYMDGPAIFTFAITAVPRAIKTLLDKLALSATQIDWYVYHQANMYMLENLARRSQIPLDKMILDMRDIGNTVSASVPIALQRAVESGRIQPGQRLVLAGFGVG